MIGVLALQGGFKEHITILTKLGLEACEIRTREELMREDVTGLIIPGGESTVMGKFIDEFGLRSAISHRAGLLLEPARAENPHFIIYGTCAGLILLAKEVPNLKGEPLGLLDVTVERNAYGSQLDSFITDFGSFIRAPKITRVGEGVEVVMKHDGLPILVREKNIWGGTFHPELVGNVEIHRMIFDRQK